MKFSSLTFIVTDDCNFNCSYCFQKKEKNTINNATIKRAVDFFYPYLKSDKIYIGFYGGEPLLAYEQVKYAVLLILEKNKKGNKKIEFNITTNGSLLTEEMLAFFNLHKFVVLLSFDGLAQDKGRKRGTLGQMVRIMKAFREYPGIHFEVNSVFSPQTVGDLSASLRFIIEQGGSNITFNISATARWQPADMVTLRIEINRLAAYLHCLYKDTGIMPVNNFRGIAEKEGGKKGIFRCNAGNDHMAVTPGGEIWGCFLFHDYFKTREDNPQYRDYYFGTLPDFIADFENRYHGIAANYAELRQDFFRVEEDYCFLCPDLRGCMVCPVNAAYSSGSLGRISAHHCKIERICRQAAVEGPKH